MRGWLSQIDALGMATKLGRDGLSLSEFEWNGCGVDLKPIHAYLDNATQEQEA